MRMKLPHSQVGYDLPEAQEMNDMLIALKRFVSSDFLDDLDIEAATYRFPMTFECSYDDAFPASFRVKLPFPVVVEKSYFSSMWGGAPAGSVIVYSRLIGATSNNAWAELTPGTPIDEAITIGGYNVPAGKTIIVTAVAGGVPAVSLLGWSLVLNCKALVEVT